jgi:hypothetical protein
MIFIIIILTFSNYMSLNLATRTLANSMEAFLFILAFYFY